MKKIIFIEGLPTVGKTYLVNEIRKRNLRNVYVVDEIINPDIKNAFIDSEDKFLKNDEMKVNKYDDGIIIIDRGPISTLVYNQVLNLIDNKYDTSYVEKWFEQFLNIYKSDNTYNYYLNNPGTYNPSLYDDKNPFGSIENLKLTHAITIFNLNKYAKNYRVCDYDKTNLEELLNEIIN